MALNGTPAKQHFRWGQSDASFLTTSTFGFTSDVCKMGGAQQQQQKIRTFEQRSSLGHTLSHGLKFVIFWFNLHLAKKKTF